MSKIECECGNIIVDQTDNLENKAYFIRDQNIEKLEERSKLLAEFISAILENRKESWLESFFSSPIYNSLDNESIISDILLKYDSDNMSMIYVCQNCGRLKVQKGQQNFYLTYNPNTESEEYINIFKGLKGNSASP